MTFRISEENESDTFERITDPKPPQNPTVTLMLLITIAVGQMSQYCIVALYCAKIPGNKFYNGILFGTGELSAMFFSGWLMNNFKDLTGFYITMAILAVSQAVLIFFPFPGMHIYLAVFLLVGMLGGWINI